MLSCLAAGRQKGSTLLLAAPWQFNNLPWSPQCRQSGPKMESFRTTVPKPGLPALWLLSHVGKNQRDREGIIKDVQRCNEKLFRQKRIAFCATCRGRPLKCHLTWSRQAAQLSVLWLDDKLHSFLGEASRQVAQLCALWLKRNGTTMFAKSRKAGSSAISGASRTNDTLRA